LIQTYIKEAPVVALFYYDVSGREHWRLSIDYYEGQNEFEISVYEIERGKGEKRADCSGKQNTLKVSWDFKKGIEEFWANLILTARFPDNKKYRASFFESSAQYHLTSVDDGWGMLSAWFSTPSKDEIILTEVVALFDELRNEIKKDHLPNSSLSKEKEAEFLDKAEEISHKIDLSKK
jgi:hypothetical protein